MVSQWNISIILRWKERSWLGREMMLSPSYCRKLLELVKHLSLNSNMVGKFWRKPDAVCYMLERAARGIQTVVWKWRILTWSSDIPLAGHWSRRESLRRSSQVRTQESRAVSKDRTGSRIDQFH